MTDLLPCPFCGSKAERIDNGPTKEQAAHDRSWGDDYDDGGSFIRCTKCDASTAIQFDRKEHLYSAWNERTPVCGFSCNGVNVYGDKTSIDAVFEAFHSHSQIEDLRRNLRHWRNECGKLHAKLGAGPPVTAFSGDHKDDRVLRLHFNRKVTDEDRKWMLEAINAWWPNGTSPVSPSDRADVENDGGSQ